MGLTQLLSPSKRSMECCANPAPSPRSTAKVEIHVSRPYHRTTLLRHPCWRSQADTTVDRGEVNAPLTPFAGSGSRPLFGFMLSPSMSGHLITAEVRSLSKWPGRPVKSPSDHDEGCCVSFLDLAKAR
jgi:hypothetical protein